MTLLNKLVGKGRKELKYHEYLNFHFDTAFLQCVSSNALFAGEVALVALLWFLLSAGKKHNFPRGMNSDNNFPQNTCESKCVAFRDKSA